MRRIAAHEGLNFVLTNRIPRNLLTVAMGRFSKIRHPWVFRLSMAIWRTFSDLDLSEAERRDYRCLHDVFIRRLQPGARPIDPRPQVIASPSEGLIGAYGRIEAGSLLQAKGQQYALADLLTDADLARQFEGGSYVTLRLTSTMYHRFHAPADLRIEQIDYVAGEAFNVNPPAVQRIARLFCRNERAVIRCRLQPLPTDENQPALLLVPVAAILVASIRLHCVDVLLHLRYAGPNRMHPPVDAVWRKGDELGWFEHGSTILVIAPPGMTLMPGLQSGQRILMGEPLLRRATDPAARPDTNPPR